MIMDLIKLKAFCIIAKSGSFSKAAEELFVTQPAVSAQIHDLESIYETKLFERLGHRIILTEEGKALLPFAELIIKTLEESHFAVDDVRNSTAGIIRVGASMLPGMYLLPEIIASFKKECPHISVLLTVALAAKIRHMLKENELDVGIVGSYGRKHQKSVLEEKQILKDRIVLIVGNEHSWRN
ncbi:MAG: LysR family transcriptional regulator, partial [Spirochaetes bacterium]